MKWGINTPTRTHFYSFLVQFWKILITGLSLSGFIYVSLTVAFVWFLYLLSVRSRFFRLLLSILAFAFATIYIYWRTRYTLAWSSIPDEVASFVLLASEYLGYIQQGIFYLLMSQGTNTKEITINSIQYTPTVDVLVATYNEPVSVLKRTLVACTYLDYPTDRLKIFVCDDGDRPEVENVANELGIIYIRRDNHSDAKAGNLNHAMSCSNGDLILTLDADMVPKSDFLKKSVPYFHKRNVAFVQAPQLFFNPDPFQHNLSSVKQVANEQDFFMIEMESAKSRFNATMYVGSNCIFSRAALDSIGGFATGSITEDVATGMILQSRGYKTYFIKDVLARGLAPESFSEMLHQRQRWCRGNLQAFRKWNPIFYPGLSFAQRILYMSGALYWYFGVQKLVYIISPILFLDLSIQTLRASVFSIILFWFPQFYSSMITFRSIAKGRRTTFWSHIYETAMSPSLAGAALLETFHIKKLTFRVTKKGFSNSRIQIVWSALISHTVLFIATIFGFIRQIVMITQGHLIPPFFWIVDFWALYNLIGIIFSIYVSIELPRPRKFERFALQVPIRVHTKSYTHTGELVDISEGGARIQLHEGPIGLTQDLHLSIQGVDGLISVRQVQTLLSGRFEMRLVWDRISLKQYKGLVKLLFDQPEDVTTQFKIRETSNTILTFIRATQAHIKSVFRRKRSRKTKRVISTIKHFEIRE